MRSREADPVRRGTRQLRTAQKRPSAASGVAVGLAPSALGDGAHADAGAMLVCSGWRPASAPSPAAGSSTGATRDGAFAAAHALYGVAGLAVAAPLAALVWAGLAPATGWAGARPAERP